MLNESKGETIMKAPTSQEDQMIFEVFMGFGKPLGVRGPKGIFQIFQA